MLQRLKREPGHILMTVDSVGGVWRYAMDLAQSLSLRDVRFTFAGVGPEPTPQQRAEAERWGELIWLDAPPDWLADDEAELSGLVASLEALARGVDMVHLNAPTQAAGLKVDTPVVVVSHSCVPTWFAAVRNQACPSSWSWQQRRNRAGLDAADRVVAPSHSHARALAATYGAISNVSVVHNASRTPLSQAEKQKFVFAGGRWWDDGKNSKTLDAIGKMIDWPLRAAGSLVGPNGQRSELVHAQALGNLPAEDMAGHMQSAPIIVSPSIYEPFGLVALEGAKAGAALVLADIPTYRELWDGAALFAPADDAEAFAACINRLIADHDERIRYGRAARARSRLYSIEAQANAMWSLYCAAAPAPVR